MYSLQRVYSLAQRPLSHSRILAQQSWGETFSIQILVYHEISCKFRLLAREQHSQYRAQREVCVCHVATHHHNSIISQCVFVKDGCKKPELISDRSPGLLPLGTYQYGGRRTRSATVHKVGLATLREALMGEGDENREERLDENVLDVVDEEGLQGTGSIGKDRTSRVRGLEVIGDITGIGEHERCVSGIRVDDDGKSVDGAAVGLV